MTPNQKLTRTLRGKTVTNVRTDGDAAVAVHFDDGSVMRVQGTLSPATASGSAATAAPATGSVTMVREAGASLAIELGAGTVLQFSLSDPGGSVLVRDASQTVRYAG